MSTVDESGSVSTPHSSQLAHRTLRRRAAEPLEQATREALDLGIGVEHVRVAGKEPRREHGALDDWLGWKHADEVQRLQPHWNVAEPNDAGVQRPGERRARGDRGVLPQLRALGHTVVALARACGR